MNRAFGLMPAARMQPIWVPIAEFFLRAADFGV
jgi:hypothetical protein